MRREKKIKSEIVNSEQMNSSKKLLSTPKKVLFRIIMVSLPIIVLLLIEIGLRVFNYGGNLDLFVLQKTGDVSEYVLNKDFTKRYFFQKGIKTPIPLSQRFSADKDSLTYRIFCLGASTVQGFPYPPNAGFPATLENVLSTLHTDRNVEVVNCGITAITSFSVLDMSEEVLEKYQPDLLVVYTGQNEFYGVFGQASRLSLFEKRTLLRLFLKLQHSKLFLLTRNIVNSLFGRDITDEPLNHHETLMGLIAKDVGIKLNDEIVRETEDSYKKNIEDIIVEAKNHNTDIIICNLVTNLDFAPFASFHSSNFSGKDSVLWSELIKKADLLEREGSNKEAIDLYLQALKIDPSYADTHYKVGKCFYATQNYELAKKHFKLAGDFDVIRFRAPSSFNRILKEVCKEYKVPLADIEEGFSRISSHGLIGNELLFEHLHPNWKGHLEIAKSISRVMAANGLIKKSWDWTKNLSDSVYYTMSNLTDLDQEVANYNLFQLTSYWPFNSSHRSDNYVRVGNEETEGLTKSYLTNGEEWSFVGLHIKYGLYLQEAKRLNEALAEYKAAIAIEPSTEAYNRLGRVYMIKAETAYRDLTDYSSAFENFTKGVSCFKQGLKRWPDDMELNFNLGLFYFMRNDKLDESEESFKKVLKLNPKNEKSLRFLSELYTRRNQFEDAKNTLTKAIEFYPARARFYTELGIILMREKQLKEAKNYFEKAIDIGNDLKAKYFMQKLNNELRKINN